MNDTKRAILITGCSSGIGYALATGLAAKHYRVFAGVRQKKDLATLTLCGLEAVQIDLDSSDSIHDAFTAVMDKTDGLYALINNGAYGQPGAVEDLSRKALVEQFQTNVFGTQELTNLCIPVFRRQNQGRIIQISSILGRICMANRGAYNASKFALEALSDTMRLELKGSGIFVSLIEPGPIESRFRANAFNAFKRHIKTEHSFHRPIYEAVIERLQRPGKAAFTLPASALMNPVLHALESRQPRPRYPVTIPSHVLPNLKRFIPDRWMDSVLIRSGDRPPE